VAPGEIDHDSIDIVAGVGATTDVVAAVVRVLRQNLQGVGKTMSVAGTQLIDQATKQAGPAEPDPPGTIAQPLVHQIRTASNLGTLGHVDHCVRIGMLKIAAGSTEAVEINLMQANRVCGEEPLAFEPFDFEVGRLGEVETFQVIIDRIKVATGPS
jgi:hypothetical protein